MEKLLKIDPHVHSNGISRCSHMSCEEIIDAKMELGYDGVFLMNHCQEWYYQADTHPQFMEEVIQEFLRGKAYADTKGFRFYLGLEVTLMKPHYADWLLYGVTEEFLRSSPCLYTLSQKELFQLCEKWGILLVQAHPFRQSPGEPEYMHGIEHNCSQADVYKFDMVEAFAKEYGLFITCGTDYHFKENTRFGGIFVPENCQTATDVAAYIKNVKNVNFFIPEVEKS